MRTPSIFYNHYKNAIDEASNYPSSIVFPEQLFAGLGSELFIITVQKSNNNNIELNRQKYNHFYFYCENEYPNWTKPNSVEDIIQIEQEYENKVDNKKDHNPLQLYFITLCGMEESVPFSKRNSCIWSPNTKVFLNKTDAKKWTRKYINQIFS